MGNQKKLFIHAGLPKTGTSYLQNCFELFEKQGDLEQINYPLIKEHDSFFEIHSGNASSVGHYLSPKLNPSFNEDELHNRINLLLDQVRNPSNPVLFSSEYFSTAPIERVEPMKNYLLKLGYEIELIVVVRPLRQLLFSNYMQSVKRHGCGDAFEDWVVHVAKRLPALYIKNIQAYELPIHLIRYNTDDLLPPILDLIGENISLAEKTKDRVVNRSLSRDELIFLRNINATFKDHILSTKISNSLIEKFPVRKSTIMNESEYLAYEESIKETDPPLETYTEGVARSMIQEFISDESQGNFSEIEENENLDQETVKTALEHLFSYTSKSSSPEYKETKIGEDDQARLRTQLQHYVDFLRDMSLELEQNHIYMAYQLMRLAHIGRPDGPVINRKLMEYHKRILVPNQESVIHPDFFTKWAGKVDLLKDISNWFIGIDAAIVEKLEELVTAFKHHMENS